MPAVEAASGVRGVRCESWASFDDRCGGENLEGDDDESLWSSERAGPSRGSSGCSTTSAGPARADIGPLTLLSLPRQAVGSIYICSYEMVDAKAAKRQKNGSRVVEIDVTSHLHAYTIGRQRLATVRPATAPSFA